MKLLDRQSLFKTEALAPLVTTLSQFQVQLASGWNAAQTVRLPRAPRSRRIVVCGMGGSNLASEIARDILGPESPFGWDLIRDYTIPNAVTKADLVILSSYSGTTEEVLACYEAARARRLPMVVIATGGELVDRAKKQRVPLVLLDAGTNPSIQPRYGVALQLGALLGMVARWQRSLINQQELKETISYLEVLARDVYGPQVLTADNPAKYAAQLLVNRLPIVMAAEGLSGVAHTFANQINESAKVLAHHHLLSELNHHLLEGLQLPVASHNQLMALFLTSDQYSRRIQQRIKVTQSVLEKQHIPYLEVSIDGKSPLAVALEGLLFASWASLYLALLLEQNPTDIPWVKYFKKELGKKS